MNPLEQFLSKFKTFLTNAAIEKKLVLEAVKAITNIDLSEGEIEIKDRIVYIKSHPLIRNEMFMRRARILSEIERRSGIKLRDIR